MELVRGGRSLRITFSDIAERRAYLRIPPASRVKLAKMAGAPWNTQDPDAELSDEQKEFLMRPERTVCLEAGTGGGKSMMCGIRAGCALLLPFNQVGILGDRYDHAAKEFRYAYLFIRELFKGHLGLFPRLQYVSQPGRHEYHITTLWNSWMLGCSMDSQEGAAVLGETLNMAILCEGSQISTRVLNRRILRATDRAIVRRRGFKHVRETGYLLAFTTPDQLEGAAAEMIEQRVKLTKGKLEKLQYGRVRWEDSFYAKRGVPSTMNPSFSPSVLEGRRLTMSEWEFQEVYGGVASPASGRVYSHFSMTKHVFRDYPETEKLREMRFGLGIDTGETFAAVLVGLDPKMVAWVMGEHYGRKTSTEEDAAGITVLLQGFFERLGYTKMETIWDRLDLCVVDPSSPFKIDLMEQLPGMDLSTPFWDMGGFDQLPTVLHMNALMQNDQIMVHEDCTELLEERRKWIWKSQRSQARKGHFFERAPIKEHDHGSDAERYIVLSLRTYGPLGADAPPPDANRGGRMRVGDDLLELMERASEGEVIWAG